MREFKDIFKSLRERKDLTQEEIAPMLGVTRSAVGNWEQGIREPDRETLEVIADFFNVDMNYLLGTQTDEYFADARTRQVAEKIYGNKALFKLFETIQDIPEEKILTLTEFINKMI